MNVLLAPWRWLVDVARRVEIWFIIKSWEAEDEAAARDEED